MCTWHRHTISLRRRNIVLSAGSERLGGGLLNENGTSLNLTEEMMTQLPPDNTTVTGAAARGVSAGPWSHRAGLALPRPAQHASTEASENALGLFIVHLDTYMKRQQQAFQEGLAALQHEGSQQTTAMMRSAVHELTEAEAFAFDKLLAAHHGEVAAADQAVAAQERRQRADTVLEQALHSQAAAMEEQDVALQRCHEAGEHHRATRQQTDIDIATARARVEACREQVKGGEGPLGGAAGCCAVCCTPEEYTSDCDASFPQKHWSRLNPRRGVYISHIVMPTLQLYASA